MNLKLKKLFGRLAMIMTAGLLVATPALAVEYVDIDQPYVGTLFGSSPWDQTFVPFADNITAVSLYSYDEVPGIFAIEILDAVCGNTLASGSGSGTGVGWVKCDLIGAQALVPGNTYVIRVLTDKLYSGSCGNPYEDGSFWRNCIEFSDSTCDLSFKTWTDEEAVPSEEATWGTMKSLYR